MQLNIDTTNPESVALGLKTLMMLSGGEAPAEKPAAKPAKPAAKAGCKTC